MLSKPPRQRFYDALSLKLVHFTIMMSFSLSISDAWGKCQKHCESVFVGRCQELLAHRMCRLCRCHGQGGTFVVSPPFCLLFTAAYLLAFTGPLVGYIKHYQPRRISSWPVSCTLSPLLQPGHSGRHIPKDFSHTLCGELVLYSTCRGEIDDGLLCDMIPAIAYSV